MTNAQFLIALARKIKTHPQAYPVWLQVLSQDVMEIADLQERQDEERWARRALMGSSTQATFLLDD